MAAIRKITRDDHDVVPWKNGGGITRVIASGGSHGDHDDWGWRVSIATVERDGAYSEFPGVNRLTTVVVGNGTDLFHPDGSTIALNPLQPTLIPSDVALWGILRDDPILNLNVMTRRGHYTASVEIVGGPGETANDTGLGDLLLVHVLSGQCKAGITGGTPQNLSIDESLIVAGDGATTIDVCAAARIAAIRIAEVVS